MLSQLVPWPGRDGTLLPPLSCGRAEPRHRAAGWDGRGRRAQEGPGEKPQGGLGRGSRALTLGGRCPSAGSTGDSEARAQRDPGRAQRTEVPGGFTPPRGAACSSAGARSDASVRGEARGRGCPRSGLRGGAMEGEASAAGAEVGALRSERPGPERCVGLMRPLPLMTSARGKADEWARWLEAGDVGWEDGAIIYRNGKSRSGGASGWGKGREDVSLTLVRSAVLWTGRWPYRINPKLSSRKVCILP